MRTLVVDPDRPEPAALAEAAACLRAGRLVAFPTETVYGLGARLLDPVALGRVFAAKGRPAHHPLIAHVIGTEDARAICRFDDRATRLAERFWPGALTLVLPRLPHVPPEVAAGTDTLAVRAPAHPVARGLIAALGEPIAAPSANRYQQLSPTIAAHVARSLGDAVELILDGGACLEGIESTVIDLTDARPRLLRPGALPLPALRAVLPELVVAHASVAAEARRASPGLDARHYAPRLRLELVADRAAAVACAGPRVGLLLRGAPLPAALPGEVRVLPDDPAGYARGLFATLHDLDACDLDRIVVEAVPPDERWLGVADRLARGAAPPEPIP